MPDPTSGSSKSLASSHDQDTAPQPVRARFLHKTPQPPFSEDRSPPEGNVDASTSTAGYSVNLATSLWSSGMELRPLGKQSLSRRTPSSHELEESGSDEEPTKLLPTSFKGRATVTAGSDGASKVYPNSRNSLPGSISETLVETVARQDSGRSTTQKPCSPKPSKSAPNQHRHNSYDPAPVGATTLFSRRAAPLSLPELDSYIESLPPAVFSRSSPDTRHQNGSKSPKVSKFEPYELLTKHTLTELKANGGEPPIWKDRNTLFGMVTGWVLGLMGSSAMSTYYSLQGVYGSVQIFALLLSSVVHIHSSDTQEKWRQLILGTVPNVLALNVSALTQSVVFFLIFQLIALLVVAYFHHATTRFVRSQPMHEGLLEYPEGSKGHGWGVLWASFILITLYLPVSTIAIHALVWTSDFWPVPNPYLNATSFPPTLPPLGPSTEFRDPLDFCWTTTMRKDSLNWAPFLVIFSLLTFALVTIYFPVRLYVAIKHALPIVDRYSELGRRRTSSEMEREYQRLLVRDQHPLSFLYNEFRRAWGTYKSLYLVIKLVALLTVALIDPNNCLFRNSGRAKVDIIRQIVLLVETSVALAIQTFLSPFIDPVSNASEWTSRACYVITSVIGLLVAMNVPSNELLNGPLLYVVYALNYGLNIYFAAVNLPCTRVLIKRFTRRIDFSVDVFSPSLKLNVHVNRRIYQESLSILMLASPQCKMEASQNLIFSEPSNGDWPPYLMDFSGSPAERHVENLKILRDVGFPAYQHGVIARYGKDRNQFKEVERRIEREFVGPDAYWKPLDSAVKGCAHYFGHAWWIPFPPTLVIKYDRGGVATLTTLPDLSHFVEQNAGTFVVEKRRTRLALRCLDHEVVSWPYTKTELVGERTWLPWGGPRYKIQSTTTYRTCTFEIKRRGIATWHRFSLGSGFQVEMRYGPGTTAHSPVIGLDDDFNVSPLLARFLLQNKDTVSRNSPRIEEALDAYRRHLRKMSRWKQGVLSYAFLTNIYFHPNNASGITGEVELVEKDLRVRDMVLSRQVALTSTHDRIHAVTQNALTSWWYLFWDDFWRQNHRAYTALRIHETDFNPQYPTSLAYRPLPRAALERFLDYRGMLALSPRSSNCMHTGILNKMYVRMSQIAFRGASRIIRTHIGGHAIEFDISEIEWGHPKASTLDTGGGTDQDDSSIRVRPTYMWEGIYDDPFQKNGIRLPWHSRLLNRFAVWFGITPLRKRRFRSTGVGFDIKLEGSRYVAIHDADDVAG